MKQNSKTVKFTKFFFRVNDFWSQVIFAYPFVSFYKFSSFAFHILISNPTPLLNDPSDICVAEKSVYNDWTGNLAQLHT